MFHRAWRLLAVAAVASSLGACITSKYDIGADLKPEFPIKPGSYVNKEGTIIDVRKLSNEYRVYNRKNKDISYARLYKIPEYSEYVFEFYDRKKPPIYYFFLKTTEKGFDFYDVENGKRDTLYVIREVSRANLKMIKIEKDGYERLP